MKTGRNWIGIGLFAAAVIAMPFGYWTDFRWYFVALVLGVCGLVLMRSAPRSLGNVDLPPGPHELRGFAGSRILGRTSEDHADVDD